MNNKDNKNEVFDLLYKKLNSAQKEAVDTIEGPVMVIAGPGTGKTTILTLRIANILRKTDTPANGILAITYTDAGVKAMRIKLQEIIGKRAHDVRIHTFHSFAGAIISEYPDHFIELQEMKQITDIEQESIIRKILEEKVFAEIRPIGKPDAYIISILKSVDDAKRNALTPDMVMKHAEKEIERIKNDEESISSKGATKGKLKAVALDEIEKCQRTKLFSKVYEKYEEEKIKAKKMDFNDLIIELLVKLRNDELLLRLVQEQFLYILVDEHQDTNDAQNFIIKLIAEFFQTPNIFIVGDEKQAIYRFQGASVENFLLLQKTWPEMKVISLDTNYRSHQNILDIGFNMIENNYKENEYKDLRIKLKSGSNIKSKPIDIIIGENIQATEKYLIEKLKEIEKKEPEAMVAIITRRNRELDRVLRILESQAIPVSSERSVDIFKHPIGILFFNIIEYIADNTRFEALAKTLISGMWGLSFEKSIEIINLLRSGKEINFKKEIPALIEIQKELLVDDPIGFLIDCAKKSKFIDLIFHDTSNIYVWRSIIALAESIIKENEIHDPLSLINNLLAYRLSAETKIVRISVGTPDLPIQAMTAHGSKGLEFDYVFIPYATEEKWIGRSRGNSFILPRKSVSDNDIRDIRRLFYVAMTRARKHLSILTHLEESDGKKFTELRFISELDNKMINYIKLNRVDADFVFNKKKELSIENNFSKRIIEIAKKVILEKGLSVTALNHFLNCPNEFIYKSILKLPQAPNINSEKGNAMHFALSRVWNLDKGDDKNLKNNKKDKEISVKVIENIIKDSVLDFLDKSLISSKEKELIKEELIENAPIVTKALESHFALKNNVQNKIFTEHWVEINFESKFAKEKINFPLHGKLDAIIDNGNEALVFDYKTKQSMSIAEIKGETKNSTGDYFRQLIFYKMLLEDNAKWKSKKIKPALVFVSPDGKDRCPIMEIPVSDGDIKAVKVNIQSLIDSVWNDEIVKSGCGKDDCEWCKLRRV